jgi:hypothetical protein
VCVYVCVWMEISESASLLPGLRYKSSDSNLGPQNIGNSEWYGPESCQITSNFVCLSHRSHKMHTSFTAEFSHTISVVSHVDPPDPHVSSVVRSKRMFIWDAESVLVREGITGVNTFYASDVSSALTKFSGFFLPINWYVSMKHARRHEVSVRLVMNKT